MTCAHAFRCNKIDRKTQKKKEQRRCWPPVIRATESSALSHRRRSHQNKGRGGEVFGTLRKVATSTQGVAALNAGQELKKGKKQGAASVRDTLPTRGKKKMGA